MRNWKILVISLLLLCLCSCGDTSSSEQPHLYWKTVTAVVTDNDVKRSFTGTHYAEIATTTVYNEEYDLKATLTAKGSGIPWEIELKKGDKVIVIAGADKGKTGTIQKVFPKLN